MNAHRMIVAAVLAIWLAEASAEAGFISGSPVGLSDPGVVLTFDEVVLPAQTSVTDQYAAYGVTFGPFAMYDEVGNPGNPNITGNYITNFIANGVANRIESIQFDRPVTAAAFAIATQTGTTSFTAYLNGFAVDSGSASTNLTSKDNYFGFQNEVFDEISFSVASYDLAAVVDNLQFTFASVPEPTSWILLASGLGCGAIALRVRSGWGTRGRR